MNGWRSDAKVSLDVCLGRRAPIDLAVMEDEGKVLTLTGGERTWHGLGRSCAPAAAICAARDAHLHHGSCLEACVQGSNVRHERRAKGREAAFGTSARWRG